MNISARIRELEDTIQDLEFQLAVKREVLQALKGLAADESAPTKEPTPAKPGTATQWAIDVLQEKGRAMRVTQIASAIRQKGIQVPGSTDLLRLVASALRRRKDIFDHVSRGKYSLKELQAASRAKGGEQP